MSGHHSGRKYRGGGGPKETTDHRTRRVNVGPGKAEGNMNSRTTTGNCRSTAARLIAIIRALATGRHNASALAERLEVSHKTVLRDIEFLRDRVGLEIRFDHADNVWGCHGLSFRDAGANLTALNLLAGGAR